MDGHLKSSRPAAGHFGQCGQLQGDVHSTAVEPDLRRGVTADDRAVDETRVRFLELIDDPRIVRGTKFGDGGRQVDGIGRNL